LTKRIVGLGLGEIGKKEPNKKKKEPNK